MDGQYRKGDRTMSTNEWLLTSDFWQFLEPWHGRWYEYKIFIASCTDNIYDLENERWLLGDMIDHVGIYGSRVTEGLSAFNVDLVLVAISGTGALVCFIFSYSSGLLHWQPDNHMIASVPEKGIWRILVPCKIHYLFTTTKNKAPTVRVVLAMYVLHCCWLIAELAEFLCPQFWTHSTVIREILSIA